MGEEKGEELEGGEQEDQVEESPWVEEEKTFDMFDADLDNAIWEVSHHSSSPKSDHSWKKS